MRTATSLFHLLFCHPSVSCLLSFFSLSLGNLISHALFLWHELHQSTSLCLWQSLGCIELLRCPQILFFLSFYLSVRFTQKCENMQSEKSHAIVRALPLLNRLQYVCGQSHQLFIWHQTERGERENLLLFFSFLLFSPSHVQTGYAIVRIQLHALQSNTKVNLSPYTYAQ